MSTKHWLALSLTLNVAAVGLLVAVANRPASNTAERSPTSISATTPQTAATADPAPAAPADPKAAKGGNWIDTLRAAGLEERLLARVVSADFDDRWLRRMRDMQRKFERGEADEAELEQFYAEREIDEEKEMKAALGEEGYVRWDKDRLLAEYDTAALKLSPAETDALYALRKDVDRNRRELDAGRRKGDLSDGQVEVKTEAFAEEFDKKLKELLGDRYASLPHVENASGVGELRRNLKTVKATDEQLNTMTKALQQWNDQRAKLEEQLQKNQITVAEYDQQMKGADAARDQEYQKSLGADGYAEFQKAQDNRYRTMKRFAPAWGLTDGDIDHLYGTMRSYEANVQDYQQRAAAIEEQGQQVDWPAVQNALQEYSRQTEELLKKSLGEERFYKLKGHSVVVLEPQ